MTYGSLCTGIGGLDLAYEHVTGDRPGWFCEADPHARAVLARHWPGVPIYPDLKTLVTADTVRSGGRTRRSTGSEVSHPEPVDTIIAGYPCQPFSHAGKQRGTADPRHLWPYIFDAVRVLRPRQLVCENVAAHLGLGFDRVLADLASIGFDVEWTVVRASDVGAAHRRARLFFAATDTDSRRREVRAGRQHTGSELRAGADERRAAPADAADVGCERERDARRRRSRPAHGRSVDWGDYLPAIQRWEHTIGRPAPHPLDDRGRLDVTFVEWLMGFDESWINGLTRTAALRCLGNAVVPQQGAYALASLTDALTAETEGT